jgi:hypothetical protein
MLEPKTQKAWRTLHRDSQRALIAAERRTLTRLTAPVRAAQAKVLTAAVKASGAPPAQAQVDVTVALAHAATQLREEYRWALEASYDDARTAGRTRHAVEVALIALLLGRVTRSRTGLSSAQALYSVRAAATADAMASLFRARYLDTLQTWVRAPTEFPLVKVVSDAEPYLTKRLETHAATETAVAVNGEHASAASEFAADYAGEDWIAGVHRVWSAILDARTCPSCWSHDGETVQLGKPFSEGVEPPLHARCRCLVMTVLLTDALARKMPGIAIDYSQMKQDVREFFQTERAARDATGKRHAVGYLRAADKKTSPQTLTRILTDRNYLP